MHQGQILNFQNRFIWDCDEIWRRNERSKAKEKRYRVFSPLFPFAPGGFALIY